MGRTCIFEPSWNPEGYIQEQQFWIPDSPSTTYAVGLEIPSMPNNPGQHCQVECLAGFYCRGCIRYSDDRVRDFGRLRADNAKAEVDSAIKKVNEETRSRAYAANEISRHLRACKRPARYRARYQPLLIVS